MSAVEKLCRELEGEIKLTWPGGGELPTTPAEAALWRLIGKHLRTAIEADRREKPNDVAIVYDWLVREQGFAATEVDDVLGGRVPLRALDWHAVVLRAIEASTFESPAVFQGPLGFRACIGNLWALGDTRAEAVENVRDAALRDDHSSPQGRIPVRVMPFHSGYAGRIEAGGEAGDRPPLLAGDCWLSRRDLEETP